VAALHQAGVPLSIVNAQHAHHFARGAGRRAKTDRLDANLLADFGSVYTPQPTVAPSTHQAELAA
jgi:transposase